MINHYLIQAFLFSVLFPILVSFLSVCMSVCMLSEPSSLGTPMTAAPRRRRHHHHILLSDRPPVRLSTTAMPCNAGSRHTIHRELSRFKHCVSSGYAHVSGRGCFHCICDDGSLLQVSCSTQKLLPVPQVSVQMNNQVVMTLFLFSLFSNLPTYFQTIFIRLLS